MTDQTTTPHGCTWCGKPGHIEADHPLSPDHPDFDGFYDMTDGQLAAHVSPTLGGES